MSANAFPAGITNKNTILICQLFLQKIIQLERHFF